MTAPTITPRAAALIEDTEWLVRMGTPHWMIPPRVGYADGQGLRAKLRRLGRADLADRIHTDYRETARSAA